MPSWSPVASLALQAWIVHVRSPMAAKFSESAIS
eukprot:CAMPEP_0195030782 /NCGR_PEP_ID=MMETSP0326_2-20130528/59725_1 /TAXON_ID=2866 ORGANISM="Crypthecodinium cohnii, Strain Seligo" /NCGR_SAMPLE_ID=MMETSP0326_2 /ASSEMBLY_ACC=CAM_ASM_000348 /LENGTH=33 /DNA_ID= /DNA_START= /DNA_END= /DNA_ORIENTATION=